MELRDLIAELERAKQLAGETVKVQVKKETRRVCPLCGGDQVVLTPDRVMVLGGEVVLKVF